MRIMGIFKGLKMDQYFYRIERGAAILCKGDGNAIKKIGTFANDSLARDACEKHYAKACKALENLGKPCPQKFYF